MTARSAVTAGLVRIVVDGAFGAEVADHLGVLIRSAGGITEVISESLEVRPDAAATGADLLVRASWRDIGTEFDVYAEAALGSARPFIPVAYGHPYVRIGPAVVPGGVPCHRCHAVRARQHATAEDAVNAECEVAMAADARLGVAGYPPHIAAVAAGSVLALLRPSGRDGPTVRTGRMTRIDCVTDEVVSWPVVAVHGCPVCGPDIDPEVRAKAGRDRLRAAAGAAFRDVAWMER
jgi:bacteriocin biosynthesis cyclodehydratase domain-containing protein